MNPDELTLIYREAYLLLLERIADKTARGNVTNYETALLADVRAILTELDEEAASWVANAIPDTYQAGMAASIETLREFGQAVEAQARIVGIHQEAVEVLAENAASDLLEANQVVGRRARDAVRRAGLQAVTTKVSTGATVREAKDILLNRLVEQGLTTVGGMRLPDYAALVAQTTTSEAGNLARVNTQSNLGFDLVKMTVHSPTCDICSAYQGRVYSISGNDPRFPALYGTAFRGGYNTIHPRCSHKTVPYVEELQSEEEVADAETASNKAFKDNRSIRELNAYREGQARKAAARKRRREKEERILESAA